MLQSAQEVMSERVASLAMRVLAGQKLTREEARTLTEVEGDELYDLLYWSNKIRIKFVGRHVEFCSIVAGKVGGCSEDCKYCSQSAAYRTHVTPSRMDVDEMLQAADEAAANGAVNFGVVNSGRGPTERELDWLETFYKRATDRGHIGPCATLGELTEAQADRLVEMGVKRINHNIETSRRMFPHIVSTHTYDDRIRTIEIAKSRGMSVCAGGIFGMGENWEDRLDMAFELDRLDVESVPLNFLYAIEGTPLAHAQHGHELEEMTPFEALKIIALFRFLLPTKTLKIGGGREKILRDMQSWIFMAGANSFLIGNYLTTFGRTPKDDHQLLKDLQVPIMLHDESIVEADPAQAGDCGPGNAFKGKAASLMSRREGSLVSLSVMNQGEKLQKQTASAGNCCGH